MEKEIIINYEEAKKDYDILIEASKEIEKQKQELNKLNSDLCDYWTSGQQKMFQKKVDSYLEQINEYKKKLDNDSETLNKCMELYQMIDKEFSSRVI